LTQSDFIVTGQSSKAYKSKKEGIQIITSIIIGTTVQNISKNKFSEYIEPLVQKKSFFSKFLEFLKKFKNIELNSDLTFHVFKVIRSISLVNPIINIISAIISL